MTGRSLSILSIDDEVVYQQLLSMFFGVSGGHMLHTALSGAEGLEMAARLKPDAILLDLRLPDTSGKRVLNTLNETEGTARIPVYIVSGAELGPHETAALYASENLRHIWKKPFNPSALLKMVENQTAGPDLGGLVQVQLGAKSRLTE